MRWSPGLKYLRHGYQGFTRALLPCFGAGMWLWQRIWMVAVEELNKYFAVSSGEGRIAGARLGYRAQGHTWVHI